VTAPRSLPALLLLFVGSGCAALIYEVVWFQLLELVIGSSAVSMGILLGTFMGGMCLGSWFLPHLLSTRRHPLRVYAALELGIAAIGVAVLFGMPLVGRLYTAWAGTGPSGLLIRGVAAGCCLVPPTLLMGATLPAMARWVEASPRGVAWLGWFYGGNTVGAVVGSVLAGYYLLRVYDSAVTTYVAVAINIVVAVGALVLAGNQPHLTPPHSVVARSPAPAQRLVHVVAALSGFTALACEVLWTRTLSLLFGATVYTFSLILAVFLGGLGLGSGLAAALGPLVTHPRRALAICQLALGVAMAWASFAVLESLPRWPINPTLITGPWMQFQLDLARTTYAVLPAAVLWGASFPLALASVSTAGADHGRLVGSVYAWNTLGAIVGSLGASLLLTVWLGTQRTQQLLILTAALSGGLLLWRDPIGRRWLVPAALGVAALALSVGPVPGMLVAYGRHYAGQPGDSSVIYVGEGWNASVAVTERANGVRNYHNAGKVQASSEPQDMRLQRMLGHLTTLVPAAPRRVLVIGCGAGVTAGAVSIDPAVEHETIAEIEPLVPEVVSTYFGAHNFEVVTNPKVHVHIDDARHFLQTSGEAFDAITSDPLDPWVKGAAMLYTREFFELAKARLNRGGVMTLFIQLYESNVEAVKSEIGTFFDVFPDGLVFANTYNGAGYDLVLLGGTEPLRVDLQALETRLASPEYTRVVQSLREIGMEHVIDLFGTYAGRAVDFAPWLADAQKTSDRNLRLQYLAGLGLNLYKADAIFREMQAFGQPPPPGLFAGTPAHIDALLQRVQVTLGRE